MDHLSEIVLATTNSGKLVEFQRALNGSLDRIIALTDFGHVHEIEENALTFAGNAALKARGYAFQTRKWTLADDSGLAVDALKGRPGVYSARYGGEGATDHQKRQLLLSELTGFEWAERTARFVCCLALSDPTGSIAFSTEGTCAGHITVMERGSGGFGYDPIFQPVGFELTFGELPPSVKDRMSHRAQALGAFRYFLKHQTS